MSTDSRRTAATRLEPRETLLYVTDLLSDSDETLASACKLAEDHDADVELVHVIDVTRAPSRPDGQMGIQYRLERLGHRLKSVGEHVKSLLLFGSAEDVIPRRAGDIGAKLIAFGTGGSPCTVGQQKLIHSVTQRVTCPVVTIPSNEFEEAK